MLDLFHDAGGGCRPIERTRVKVVLPNVVRDGTVELVEAMEGSAPEALASDFGKPPLHSVQPRGTA